MRKVVVGIIIVGAILYGLAYFMFAYIPGPKLLPDTVVSNEAVSFDGSKKVFVIRRGYINRELGDLHKGYSFYHSVKNSVGSQMVALSSCASYSMSEWKPKDILNIRFHLEWTDENELKYTGGYSKNHKEGIAYCFDSGVVPLMSDVYQIKQEDIHPLTENIKNNLPIISTLAEGLPPTKYIYINKDSRDFIQKDIVVKERDVVVILGPNSQFRHQIICYGPIIMLRSTAMIAVASDQWIYFGKKVQPEDMHLIMADQLYFSKTFSENVPDLEIRCKGLPADYRGRPWPKIYTKNPPIIVPDEEDITIPYF